MRYNELIENEVMSPANYKLQQKYDDFNRKYFDNTLPKIPVSFAKLKGMGGKVEYTVVRPAGTPEPNPRMVRLGLVDKLAGGTIKPGTLKLTLSSLYMRNEQELDRILAHEMVHVYMVTQGKFSEQHGPEFLRVAKELGKKMGVEIPLKDDVSNLVADSTQIKPIAVIILKKKDLYSFAILNVNNIDASLPAIQERWTYMIKYNYADEVYVYKIASPLWTQISYKFTIQRMFSSNTGYYHLKVDGALEDLANNGKLLLELKK
jgi:hypothetical protein